MTCVFMGREHCETAETGLGNAGKVAVIAEVGSSGIPDKGGTNTTTPVWKHIQYCI